MQYLWRLIFHFLSSNSRHGTHSPFVYSMANDVIYAKPKNINEGNRRDVLLFDLATYFDVGYTTSYLDGGINKALIVDGAMEDIEQLAALHKQFKYLVLPDIYKYKARKRLWDSICCDPRFIVCIDLFHYGLIFYRSEQPKELFKLRFPYWR